MNQLSNSLRHLTWLFSCLAASACSSTSGSVGESGGAEKIATSRADLTVVGPRSVSTDFLDIQFLAAGVAADRKVVFVGDPLDGQVIAYSRATRQQIGTLPQPPPGFILPFIMHSLGEGRVGVLDAGGLPQPKPFAPVHPFYYEYTYTFTPSSGFSATLARFVDSGSIEVGFPEDFVKLPDGRVLMSDAVLGSVWIIQTDGTFAPGIVPKTFNTSDAIPQMVFCPTMPEVTVNGVPFLFSGSTNPGIEAIAVRNGTAFFHSPCARGLFKFPISILSDSRQPYQRAADIQLVASTPADIQVEELLDMQFNSTDPSDTRLYAAHALQLEILRIDSTTGARTVLASDSRLFDFPSSIAFLPPGQNDQGGLAFLVVSNQQERTPITNDAVSMNSFITPFLEAKVQVQDE
jgi:hypothetical protein